MPIYTDPRVYKIGTSKKKKMPPKKSAPKKEPKKDPWAELLLAVDDLEDEEKQAAGYAKLFVRMHPDAKEKDRMIALIKHHFGLDGYKKYKMEQTLYRHDLKKQREARQQKARAADAAEVATEPVRADAGPALNDLLSDADSVLAAMKPKEKDHFYIPSRRNNPGKTMAQGRWKQLKPWRINPFSRLIGLPKKLSMKKR